MASALTTRFVEPDRSRRDAGPVPDLPSPFLLLTLSLGALTACGATGGRPEVLALQRPTVAVVTTWPAATAFRIEVQAPVAQADSELGRAARVWWREALRQTVAFELRDAGERRLPLLRLSLDTDARALAATLVDDRGERALAGASFATRDLPAAIDELAWAVRLALGEAAAPPLPVALGTSSLPTVVLAVDDAQALLRDGGIEPARALLQQARSRDGGSPFVLDGLGAVALLRGELAAAERAATEALGYEQRLLPTTRHRLARTLLLARASRQPDTAAAFDRELLRLGETGQRERPHDPQPEFSIALAHNFRGDFEAARPRLQTLRTRLPDQSIVAYHLGWACLGSGDAAAAIEPFEFAAVRLPTAWLLLPRAIALFEAGRTDELGALLQRLRDDEDGLGRGLQHEVTRMLAAQALLAGDDATARRLLMADLLWLFKHPQLLPQRVGEFAEQGALLVRLGGDEGLPALLAAIQQQQAGTAIADACAFVGGMLQVRNSRERATALETQLGRGGDSVFEALLAAYAHELRGELADQQAALARAARLSDTPMTKALLARCLHGAGRVAEAEALQAALDRELRRIALRQRCQHPLTGPELAYAVRTR
jgi:tetratricopeptide (TPR) repeat protein